MYKFIVASSAALGAAALAIPASGSTDQIIPLMPSGGIPEAGPSIPGPPVPELGIPGIPLGGSPLPPSVSIPPSGSSSPTCGGASSTSCSPQSGLDLSSILSALGLGNLGSINMAGSQSSFTCAPSLTGGLISSGPGLMMGGPSAIFWQSNDPVQNVVFSANVDDNGIMTFGGAFSTGGRGAHIGPDINAPNGLASQASVKVVQDKLVVVNAGSDTATLYQIDFENPALIRMIGQPVSTMGNFPVSSTIDPGSRNVCVLNGGQTNGVSCYKSDLRRGLVPIPNTVRSLGLSLTTPPSSEDNTPSQIVFADDGKRLFASVKGSAAGPGFIAVWEVNDDGSLSEQFTKNVPQGGNSPASLTFVRGADAILNTDLAAGGFSIFNFAAGGANATAGAQGQSLSAASALTQIGGASHPAWSEFSDATRNYYISDLAVGELTEVQIDPETLQAQVVAQHPLPAGTIDQEVNLIDGKDTIFLISPSTMTMEVLSLVAPGNVQPKQSFDLAAAAAQAGVPLSPANVQGVNGFFTG